MPYIRYPERRGLDHLLEPVLSSFPTLPPGHQAYVLFRILASVARSNLADYATYASLVGVVETTLDEFKRRFLEPYEDDKRQENGPV
jgi:hypothetical protein